MKPAAGSRSTQSTVPSPAPDSTHPGNKSAKTTSGSGDVRFTIYKEIADVTWRMFVPSIGGVVIGVVADRSFGTKPWFTVIGVVLGFGVVIFLVWRQITATKDIH